MTVHRINRYLKAAVKAGVLRAWEMTRGGKVWVLEPQVGEPIERYRPEVEDYVEALVAAGVKPSPIHWPG